MPALLTDSTPELDARSSTKAASEIPYTVTRRLLSFVSDESRRSLRLTCRAWARAIDAVSPPSLSKANTLPPEILTQIFYLQGPRDFDNARRSCSQWMRASLNERLLESMLKRAGWWDSWLWDNRNRCSSTDANAESPAWRMSKRFATECILSGRKTNVERSGFLTTSIVDFSQLSRDLSGVSRQSAYSKDHGGLAPSSFQVSNCGNYLLVISAGCMIHIYKLSTKRLGTSLPTSSGDLENTDIAVVASITCPSGVQSVAIDTTTSQFTVAALMDNRLGMICNLIPVTWRDSDRSGVVYDTTGSTSTRNGSMYTMTMASRHFFYDVCSADDPPLSISICPGQRCVAFGSDSGIELRWVDNQTNKDCRRHIPMSQPSEILHWLPNRSDTPLEFRLISSLAGPGMDSCGCKNLPPAETRPFCPFHGVQNDVQTFSRWAPEHNDRLSLVRTTQCHHYRAVPVHDGLHVLFVEPRTGYLCIGSDAPIDGPTSLTRALTCVPPFEDDALGAFKGPPLPTAFAAGSDLNWGLRVVAAYGNRLVFYSVPLDVFNVIKRERERQEGGSILGDSDLARDFFINQQRSHSRRGSLAQNQNGDWEFLLSISYRPTAMMWPLKIYGKEIVRMEEDIVELGLQSSFGGARVWAFGAAGTTSVIDVDTFTRSSQEVSDIPCKFFIIGADGRIASAQLVSRSTNSPITPVTSRKRKQCESRGEFIGRHMLRQHSSPAILHAQGVPAASTQGFRHQRRPSFAARIVDVRIPELEGRWMETEAVY
ncbi:hypothetical protein BJY01DRAFT_259842 [Aspergillus pseudoustus]|uniref:F-box domain-containing protein n=1 Tax=Aspergillus pseudoustus TaxID=1810923 RepID=A0ABR4KJQ1_9EURO